MKQIFSAVLLCCSLFSIQSFAQQKVPPALNGLWILESKSGGITGRKMMADKKHPEYKAFRKDHFFEGPGKKKMDDQGGFHIVSEKSFFTGKPADVILVKDGRTWVYTLEGKKLVLRENHPDGFKEVYRKVGSY